MRTRLIRSSSDPVPAAASAKAMASQVHRPVLLHEALDSLAIRPGDTVVDATLGGAGHARAIADMLDERGALIGLDLDADAITRAQQALSDTRPKTIYIRTNFRNVQSELRSHTIEKIDKALFDLGWSSFQLSAGRGFSFLANEPLLMTYSKPVRPGDPGHSGGEDGELTAAEIVNEWEEESIADVLFGWGEERYARRIAKRIVERREEKPFTSSLDLAETVRSAVPPAYRKSRLHPATKTFQALRIAVNDELGSLKDGLEGAWQMLAEDGRIAVVTFHSLEDRIVKEMFLHWDRSGEGKRITRSPIKPSAEEVRVNPRARSAKLRVIEKS